MKTLPSLAVGKYQGVKEFHMLAHIGVIVKLWFSVLSNLKSHIIIHPRGTNDDDKLGNSGIPVGMIYFRKKLECCY